MKAIPKHAIVCATAVSVAWVVHVIVSRTIAERDVIEAVFCGSDLSIVAAAALLLAVRLFLFLLAPAWMLYIALTSA